MDALVLLRSHAFNAHVKMAFEALAGFSRRHESMLLLDVTKQDIATDIPTLKFEGRRLQRLGLALYPEDKWAWFSGDYALYAAFFARPEFSYYVMVDYDAKVNFDVDAFLDRVAEKRLDFVAPYAGFERADWMWSAAGRHWFARVAGCFFPIVVISRKLLLTCFEHRLVQSQSIPADASERDAFLQQWWMNCEAFVPSVALAEGYKMADIEGFIPGWNYAFMRDVDVLYWDMPQLANIPCAHPVFLKEELPEQIRRRLFSLPEGALREWVVARAAALRHSDRELWRAVQAVNPELLDLVD